MFLEYRLFHRRTGNRGQTCLPVGLKVIDNLPLPARYQITLRFNGRVRGSMKPRPLNIADFRLLRTHVVLVHASVGRGIMRFHLGYRITEDSRFLS